MMFLLCRSTSEGVALFFAFISRSQESHLHFPVHLLSHQKKRVRLQLFALFRTSRSFFLLLAFSRLVLCSHARCDEYCCRFLIAISSVPYTRWVDCVLSCSQTRLDNLLAKVLNEHEAPRCTKDHFGSDRVHLPHVPRFREGILAHKPSLFAIRRCNAFRVLFVPTCTRYLRHRDACCTESQVNRSFLQLVCTRRLGGIFWGCCVHAHDLVVAEEE
mmetsp:Transcript_46284/g.68918  ORF Transcript_46284/g.68918 Transcript_46284/m.68918 type:complete len:216 (+) Transcript_46284:39-686(+)